jgi:uncharacterized protein
MHPPRFLPDDPFPPYTFVPGQQPHPISDPQGHSYGHRFEIPERPEPEQWKTCKPYLRGIDLFNHGYYWEAHEVWEGLWQACGRTGVLADFFKALIHFAAAGVKVREGVPAGVKRHLERTKELLELIRQQGETHLMGLAMAEALALLESPLQHPPRCPEEATSAVPVWTVVLEPKG